jgi:DNA-binding HxlR family transcriptional regulator
MLGRTYENQDCSAARALGLVGERWSLLILRDAMFRRYTRFSEFEQSLGIAPNILAGRLASFVEAGLMEARSTGEHPEHRTYHLTGMGMELKPVVVALTEWGDRWLSPGPALFRHEGCGGEVSSALRCAGCGAVPSVKVHAVRRAALPDAQRSHSQRSRKRKAGHARTRRTTG